MENSDLQSPLRNLPQQPDIPVTLKTDNITSTLSPCNGREQIICCKRPGLSNHLARPGPVVFITICRDSLVA